MWIINTRLLIKTRKFNWFIVTFNFNKIASEGDVIRVRPEVVRIVTVNANQPTLKGVTNLPVISIHIDATALKHFHQKRAQSKSGVKNGGKTVSTN
jgi:hypothetical protein